jgi:hypothetical protein
MVTRKKRSAVDCEGGTVVDQGKGKGEYAVLQIPLAEKEKTPCSLSYPCRSMIIETDQGTLNC